jgi:hypothetical protein
VSLVFEVLEERGDDGFVELVPVEFGRRVAGGVVDEAEQQS